MMEKTAIKWLSEYSVGLETVDEQHRKFLSIVNELGKSIENGTFKEKGNKLYFSLVHFADAYLLKEKMLVNSVKDLDYSYFREKHKQFIAHLEQFKDKFNSDNTEQAFIELYNYLKELYPKFISYYTPSLVKILKENGIK